MSSAGIHLPIIDVDRQDQQVLILSVDLDSHTARTGLRLIDGDLHIPNGHPDVLTAEVTRQQFSRDRQDRLTAHGAPSACHPSVNCSPEACVMPPSRITIDHSRVSRKSRSPSGLGDRVMIACCVPQLPDQKVTLVPNGSPPVGDTLASAQWSILEGERGLPAVPTTRPNRGAGKSLRKLSHLSSRDFTVVTHGPLRPSRSADSTA